MEIKLKNGANGNNKKDKHKSFGISFYAYEGYSILVLFIFPITKLDIVKLNHGLSSKRGKFYLT